jgi:hypothetical protein
MKITILLGTVLCFFITSAAQAGGTVTVAVAPNVTMTAGGPSPGISGIDAATAAVLESQIPAKKPASPSAAKPSYVVPEYDAHPYQGKTVVNVSHQSSPDAPKRTFNPQ